MTLSPHLGVWNPFPQPQGLARIALFAASQVKAFDNNNLIIYHSIFPNPPKNFTSTSISSPSSASLLTPNPKPKQTLIKSPRFIYTNPYAIFPNADFLHPQLCSQSFIALDGHIQIWNCLSFLPFFYTWD
ncbi:unnamed protein product [Zymoseptoria tritici ST99CH_3D7]|uniref:Uncharacterized protein n=1 Tax=Zymoseptoria tritici (strain ST99CH_3D7) TaxID=1276538 RepID=A0A1X7S1U5_ZYMT9|nr:unnamed protein product [Zymoseptoria tritici ST99CH_3D7]